MASSAKDRARGEHRSRRRALVAQTGPGQRDEQGRRIAEQALAVLSGLAERRDSSESPELPDLQDPPGPDHSTALRRRAGLSRAGISCNGLCVAAYEATPREPPTDALLQALVDAGVTVIVPVTLPDLDLSWETWPQRVAHDTEAIAAADLVLAPGLAVDADGTRLGQGGGSYDRALRRLRAASPHTAVLVVLHPSEAEAPTPPLPREDHDEPVDGTLTADGVRWLRRPVAG